MADHCRHCLGSGRVYDSPISDYSPCALPVWSRCECRMQPAAPETRVHPDDALAAFIAAQPVEYLPEVY